MVGLGDGLHDGQAEAEPAGLAAEVRLGAGEAAEDVVQVVRRDAAAGVGPLFRKTVASRTGAKTRTATQPMKLYQR